MSPQRRIALVSVAAAVVLIAVKLVTGLATGSLGLLSEAAHSGTDLVAALLTLFAVGVAVRPADPGHQYGHGKAEHLAALAEASFLVVVSLLISYTAIRRLAQGTGEVEATWYALLVVGVVIVIDASRTAVSLSASRRFHSPAFGASALHFGSDLAGSTAVLVGLLATRAGYPEGDAAAALFVA
ncbi:MAG: cation diffusion facilitator family transporter, partial [Gaiellaceae bacterium]